MQIAKAEEVEVNIVGASTFGIYPKVSLEKTYNMFISDGWLINYSGFKKASQVPTPGQGRALFYSVRGGFMVAVVENTVYRIDADLAFNFIGSLDTTFGSVTIDENLLQQICIVDGESAWIYTYPGGTFTKQTLQIGNSGPLITPSYVCYHNTFFLFGSATNSGQNSAFWYAFQPFTGTPPTPTGTPDLQFVSQFSLQTKPDSALVVERLPGRGNNVLVMGSTVAEVWTQVGGAENYRRVQSFNIDYGIASIASVASNEQQICWLSQNENNSPTIMITNGSETKEISTDGIDYVLSRIKFPQQSNAFFYREDGHLFYQISFTNPADNLTLFYDFNTNQFFHASDQNLNFHPAHKVAFFQENTYFISTTDGSLYKMNTDLVTYDYDTSPTSIGQEIPRIRICKTLRRPNSDRFRVGQFTFWIEEGMPNLASPIPPRVDMSISTNGNQSFSNVVGRELNPQAMYRNQIRWWRLGQANEFTIQLRFWGFTRMVVSTGTAEIY